MALTVEERKNRCDAEYMALTPQERKEREEQLEWICEVTHAKRELLVRSKGGKDSIATLFKVFELCQDEFDVNQMEEESPEYYRILKELTQKKIKTEDELKNASRDLVVYVYRHCEEIKKQDVDLYYAVLNFIFYLKKKMLYSKILVDAGIEIHF